MENNLAVEHLDKLKEINILFLMFDVPAKAYYLDSSRQHSFIIEYKFNSRVRISGKRYRETVEELAEAALELITEFQQIQIDIAALAY